MPYKTGPVIKGLIFGCLLGTLVPLVSSGNRDLPPVADPAEYGNILINRTSEKNNVKPVGFHTGPTGRNIPAGSAISSLNSI